MTLDALRTYCLAKSGTTEETPFGPDVLVFKVMGKMFALTNMEEWPLEVNLKCDPERAIELREEYEAVQPGYHMNKKHWNTVVLNGSVSLPEIHAWIDHSYALVVQGLPKKVRDQLGDDV